MAEAAGLYYELHGPEDAPPLILSSGLGGSAGYWAPNIPALAEHFRVIAYDHRGTGRSDRALPNDLTVEHLARDIVTILNHAGVASATVVGHALGGLAGFELARVAPRRLRRLVVVNGWLVVDPATLRCFDARLHVLAGGGPDAYLAAQPIFLYPSTWISENHDRLVAEARAHRAGFDEDNLRKRLDGLRAFDAGPWIGRVVTSTLVLAARDDVLVPCSAGKALADASGATFKTMKWGGHACNVTDPDTFNRIVLEFLRS